MAIMNVIKQIDAEIARLQEARALLSQGGAPKKQGIGQAKNSPAVIGASVPKKRNLSPEGRARIAEAVRKRWLRQKAK